VLLAALLMSGCLLPLRLLLQPAAAQHRLRHTLQLCAELSCVLYAGARPPDMHACDTNGRICMQSSHVCSTLAHPELWSVLCQVATDAHVAVLGAMCPGDPAPAAPPSPAAVSAANPPAVAVDVVAPECAANPLQHQARWCVAALQPVLRLARRAVFCACCARCARERQVGTGEDHQHQR
jgi:hypothetical protein